MEATVDRLKDLYARIDAQTEAFARASGLCCPAGCGACCLSPEVEATELEMEWMAEHLLEQGLAEAVLERIAASGTPSPCVLYVPEAGNPRQGRCGHYGQRPVLCRLFAFAAVQDKTGRARLAACRVHREEQPEAAEAAVRAVEEGTLPVPLFAAAARGLLDIDPERGALRLPINAALRGALARVMARAVGR